MRVICFVSFQHQKCNPRIYDNKKEAEIVFCLFDK
jgi:hypothetical protein